MLWSCTPTSKSTDMICTPTKNKSEIHIWYSAYKKWNQSTDTKTGAKDIRELNSIDNPGSEESKERSNTIIQQSKNNRKEGRGLTYCPIRLKPAVNKIITASYQIEIELTSLTGLVLHELENKTCSTALKEAIALPHSTTNTSLRLTSLLERIERTGANETSPTSWEFD